MLKCLKTAGSVANSVNLDQTPGIATSHHRLQCLSEYLGKTVYVSIYQKPFNLLMEEVFAVKHGFTDDGRFLSNTASHTGIIDTNFGTNSTDNTTDNGGKLALLSQFTLLATTYVPV